VKPLKVLNISSGDLVGSRFNGFDWHDSFNSLNVDTKMLTCWNHHSDEEWVDLVTDKLAIPRFRALARLDYQASQMSGNENNKYWWSKDIFEHPFYKECDVVHLQIIQDGTLDLRTIQKIFQEKPTVWTWHDPWPMTGHCVYPMDCSRFSSGCGECPDLKRAFTVGKDHTRENRSLKNSLFSQGYSLHVATKWFADYITENKTTKYPTPKIIPFGLDLKRFRPGDKKKSRNRLGLDPNRFTIGIRAVREPQKNFNLFVSSLAKLSNPENFQVVTIQEKGMLGDVAEEFDLFELDWTNSEDLISDFYNSLDLFIMPSLHETFGLMALESMSMGVPIVGVKNTAIDEIANLQKLGYPISGKSSQELADQIQGAFSNPIDLNLKSLQGIDWVETQYSLEKYLLQLRKLYEETLENFTNA
jgi:glycosyltransferase involved in cell wall biosynthesis